MRLEIKDLDYLAAGLHGRRSRMAEGAILDDLCRVPAFPELAHKVFPEGEEKDVSDFQRLLVHRLALELSGMLNHLTGPGAGLVNWVLLKYQAENLKVLLRFCLTKTSTENLQQYIVPLPDELALDNEGLASAESLGDFIRLIPRGLFRESLEEAAGTYGDNAKPFFFETTLDHCYLKELITLAGKLSRQDREIIMSMVCQEADIFHLMLIIRGKFHYGLTRQTLLPMHISGTGVPASVFAAMLDDQDLQTAAGRISGLVFGPSLKGLSAGGGPANTAFDAAILERIAWKRFLSLANLAFRQSHMGLGAIVGYTGIRRIEIANLITISEGIRRGMASEAIRTRLIRGADSGVAHV